MTSETINMENKKKRLQKTVTILFHWDTFSLLTSTIDLVHFVLETETSGGKQSGTHDQIQGLWSSIIILPYWCT